MDEGLPIAYSLLEDGVPVYALGGEQVGTVHHVVAAPEKDIFHGLVITTPELGKRFVAAEEVQSLHERGADLKLSQDDVAGLPVPGGAAAVYEEDPSATKWEHWARKAMLKGDWHREK
jgi:hypothetical protein